MIEKLLDKQKVYFNESLAKILVALSNFIADNEAEYLRETLRVYEILTRQLGYEAGKFKQIVLASPKLIKYNFLARIH
jgi:hypothetical protein